jgi:hypothetical protein
MVMDIKPKLKYRLRTFAMLCYILKKYLNKCCIYFKSDLRHKITLCRFKLMNSHDHHVGNIDDRKLTSTKVGWGQDSSAV